MQRALNTQNILVFHWYLKAQNTSISNDRFHLKSEAKPDKNSIKDRHWLHNSFHTETQIVYRLKSKKALKMKFVAPIPEQIVCVSIQGGSLGPEKYGFTNIPISGHASVLGWLKFDQGGGGGLK